MAEPGTIPRHARGSAPDTSRPEEPTYAERVRTLLERNSVATLSTMSRRHSGFPFGSLMPFALDLRGRPIFLISSMAMHTQNLLGDSKASLFVAETPEDGDALDAARATLVGAVAKVPEQETNTVRELYLPRHANSRYWVDFADFAFFRMEVADVYYVGGFGMMGWVEADQYGLAQADPLVDAAAGIRQHMNADHEDSMLLLARTLLGIDAQKAAMTSVDRLGFSLRLATAEGMKGARIPFLREVRSAGEARAVLVEMVGQARAL